MQIKKRIACGLAAMARFATLPLVFANPVPATITAAHIAAMLNVSGVHVTSDQLELLAAIPATERNPRLKVTSVATFNGSAVKARLQCESTSICLPFYVLIHCQDADVAKDAISQWHAERGSPKPEILVRNGKTATMIFEGPHMRITQPVLCLQNGSRGQEIRVTGEDRARVYRARVIGPRLVRSTGASNE